MKTRYRYYSLVLFSICMIVLLPGRNQAQGELRVYRAEAERRLASRMLYDYLTELAWNYLDETQREIASINSAAALQARKRLIRERILGMLGPFPERTDLKAEVTGKLKRQGYTVEKVLFQSRPHFYVTANLYIPSQGKKPFPAVLGTCGHAMEGKTAEVYQRVWIALAKMGFVVLAFDPPGQGERLMYYEEDLGETLLHGTTIEHTMAGIQCLLTGSNAAEYFIWDGMRGIDYLLSRPEVDPARIAVTGNSGGGMQTAYLAALDDRVSVAVPSCYVTSWRRLWETIGPQDAEQNMLPFIGSGLDFPDYILAFAPKPYLINAAIQDFFSILGTRETYARAKRIYELLGAPEELALFEADDTHGYTLPRREACYAWLSKHLLGVEGPRKEPPMNLENPRNLWVTPTGQMTTSFEDAETIGSLNAAYAEKIIYKAEMPGSLEAFERFRNRVLEKVRKLVGYQRSNVPLNLQNRGYIRRPGMTVELITYESEPGITLPALLFRPDSLRKDLPRVLYASHNNKAEDAGDDIASLVARGYLVLAPDVRGKGETARSSARGGWFWEWFSRDWGIALMAFHVKKTLVGMRALDLVRAVDVLHAVGKNNSPQVVAIAKGSAGVPLLHAAAFDNRIAKVIIEDGLVSWKAVVQAKYHRRQLDNVVIGALAEYDLPVLAATLSPRTLILSNMVDPMGHRLPVEKIAQQYKQALHCYRILKRPANLLIAERQPVDRGKEAKRSVTCFEQENETVISLVH